MTVTCTIDMVTQLPTLTGLSFTKDKRNVLWPNFLDMQKRNIFTRFMYTARAFRVFSTNIDLFLWLVRLSCLFSTLISR